MFEREFIEVPRVMDDQPMFIRISQIQMFCQNADANGPIEGSTSIYLYDGLAVAVNKTPEEVATLIRNAQMVN